MDGNRVIPVFSGILHILIPFYFHGIKEFVRRTISQFLIVFKHSKELGDCPAYKLFDAVEVKRNEDVEYPRKYGDYTVAVHRDQIPETVEVSEKI